MPLIKYIDMFGSKHSIDTDYIVEGINNKYYNSNLFDTDFINKTNDIATISKNSISINSGQTQIEYDATTGVLDFRNLRTGNVGRRYYNHIKYDNTSSLSLTSATEMIEVNINDLQGKKAEIRFSYNFLEHNNGDSKWILYEKDQNGTKTTLKEFLLYANTGLGNGQVCEFMQFSDSIYKVGIEWNKTDDNATLILNNNHTEKPSWSLDVIEIFDVELFQSSTKSGQPFV